MRPDGESENALPSCSYIAFACLFGSLFGSGYRQSHRTVSPAQISLPAVLESADCIKNSETDTNLGIPSDSEFRRALCCEDRMLLMTYSLFESSGAAGQAHLAL